jgi:hypothetical protein
LKRSDESVDGDDSTKSKKLKSSDPPSSFDSSSAPNASAGEVEVESEGDLESEGSKEEEGEKKPKAGRGRGRGRGRGKGKSAASGSGRSKTSSKGRGKSKSSLLEEVASEEGGGGEAEGEKIEEKSKVAKPESIDAGGAGGSGGTKIDEMQEEEKFSKPKSKRRGRIPHPQARETDVIIEKGKLYFFYRPKVDLEHARSASEVQRLYMLMAVHCEGKLEHEKFSEIQGSMDNHVAETDPVKFRLAILASKKLPEPTHRSRGYAFIQEVSEKVENVSAALEKHVYSTATRGERHLDYCRPCGEAVYEIVYHNNATHLIYAMELPIPEHFGFAQSAFGLHELGNVIMAVKNPDHPQVDFRSRGEQEWVGGVKDKPKFPKELQHFFAGKRVDQVKFAPILSSQLLDFPHSEIVLIGTSKDMEEEFPDILAELEKEEMVDFEKIDRDTNHHPEKSTFEELHMKEHSHSTQPLEKGEFV